MQRYDFLSIYANNFISVVPVAGFLVGNGPTGDALPPVGTGVRRRPAPRCAAIHRSRCVGLQDLWITPAGREAFMCVCLEGGHLTTPSKTEEGAGRGGGRLGDLVDGDAAQVPVFDDDGLLGWHHIHSQDAERGGDDTWCKAVLALVLELVVN